jgi:hypothetical protein
VPIWFHHFAHFFVQVFVRWYTFLGTSPGGVLAQALVLLLTEVHGGWWKLETWRINWAGGLKRGAYALGLVGAVVFLACTVTTTYDDHQALTSRLSAVVNEKDELKRGLQVRDETIKRLSGSAVHVESEKDKCWIETMSMKPLPLQLPNGVVSASQTTLFCNRSYSVPYTVIFEFDQNLASAGPIVIPVAGGGMGEYLEKLWDNKISGIFDAPSIQPYRPFSVVAYGKNQTLPLVKSLTIKTASTEQRFTP